MREMDLQKKNFKMDVKSIKNYTLLLWKVDEKCQKREAGPWTLCFFRGKVVFPNLPYPVEILEGTVKFSQNQIEKNLENK